MKAFWSFLFLIAVPAVLLAAEEIDPKSDKIWFHPEMQAAIERTEAQLGGGIFKAEDDAVTIDGKKHFTGYHPLRSQYDGSVFRHFPIWKGRTAGKEIPKELDYTKIAPPNVVRQQCGDCWAQGAAMAFQGVIGWLDKASRDISRQAIIDCSGFGSCAGGQISVGFFEDPKGAVYTSDYPYRGYTQRCQNSSLTYREKARHTGFIRGSGGGKPTVADYQRALMEMGPIEGCGSSGALAGADKDGFILTNRWGPVDHCWAWYGWVDGATHGKPPGIYFIAVNSWGKGSDGWAKDGIGYVRLAKDDVNLEGSVLSEGAYIDYKDPLPQEPVIFAVDTAQFNLQVTIQPEVRGWTQDSLTKQLVKTFSVLEN